MYFIEIQTGIQKINLNIDKINLMEIRNRRFMFHRSGELILGIEGSASGKKLLYSHAEEHEKSQSKYPFDEFCRGWIGTSKDYKNGIIHFAPQIEKEYLKHYEPAFIFIEKSLENGFCKDTILRNFCYNGEQEVKQVI